MILLMGNPNVGKSIFFTELTGIYANSANYAGTTVTYMEGRVTIGGKGYTLIDVPGTYSLKPTSEVEAVAAQFMERGAQAVVCVLDASNLERNLHLALEIQGYGIPVVYALNLTDVANRHGITVNPALLARELDAPVISTVAVKRQGIKELLHTLDTVLEASEKQNCPSAEACRRCGSCPRKHIALDIFDEKDVWARAKEITLRVSRKDSASPGFLDRLGDAMLRPATGIPLALLLIALAIGVVVFGGRGLRAVALLPLVRQLIIPFFEGLFTRFVPEGVLLNILVGEFGVFVISFEWILALIFPYVLLFYVVFTFLEDTGFLPRMAVLFDNIMRKLGVQGGSLIHMLMGYGCAVPAIIGTRASTGRKERIVISAAICFAIPCISQIGALVTLLSVFAWWMLPAMLAFSLVLVAITALVAGRLVKGRVDPLLLEVPNLLMPTAKSYGRKLLTRMKHFLKDAEVPMLIAVFFAAILAETGLLARIAVHAQPLVSVWLGLPEDAVIALILGIVRREMSVAPLLALDLNSLQAFVGGVVSLLYLPCLSVFAILAKEFKARVAIIIFGLTIFVALFTGGAINQLVLFFMRG
ncbi:MAG: ferrous iron transporter B [Defluviitaleaceae bacterium]|nr:ferrous iron transporter B [Defluviitaleaceae bacterium]MCL2238641.1 ferrous iron transporter B [Defluviitaleaceae bacterium]